MPVTKIRGPIAYSQFEETKPVIGDQPVDPERGFFDNLSDTYATGWLGAVKDTVERAYVDATTGQTGFDGLNNVPMGYEEYASAYSYASSPEEVAIITANIDETNAARQRLSQNSFMENLGYGLIAGVFDPINLIGGPALKGAGFLAGAIKGGASIGGVNAATEIFRNTADPTSTNQETVANIGFGFVVAGMIGGGIGAVTKAGPGVKVRGTSNVSPEARAKADEVGNRFTKAFNRGEGRATTEIMQFNNRNVRVIDQPSTKVDASGNKVNASFRSAEAFAEYARRAAVRKAADDALGDVVPDSDEASIFDTFINEVDPAVEQYVDDYIAGLGRNDPSMEQFAANNSDAIEAEFQRRAGGVETPRTGEDAAPQTEFEDTIFIDSKAILKSFPDKPWTKPRYEGIEPLADDAFKTPEEYVNFVGYHELWHTTNKQKPNETTAQYENRINTLALEEVRADRLPNSPTRGFFSDLALLPTMQGSMTRYAPDDRFVHGLLTSTGGDHATMTIGAMAGRAATPGGSVFQRSMRWNAEYFKAAHAIRQAYSKYVRNYAAEGEFKLGIDNFTAQLPIVGTARKQGKMLFDEWNKQVGRAQFDHNEFSIDGRMLTPDEMALVREAAAKVNEVNEQFAAAAKELDIFEFQKTIQKEIAWREKANMRDQEKMIGAKPKVKTELTNRIENRNAELDDLRLQADEIRESPIKFKGDDGFFHRIFNVGVIRERYDDFADRIAMGFAREARRNNAETVLLARVEYPKGNAPDWVKEALEGSAQQKAAGRWFLDGNNKDAIDWYMKDAGEGASVVYVRVPADQLDRFRVSKIQPEGDINPAAFSRDPENEFFLSEDLARQAKTKRDELINDDELTMVGVTDDMLDRARKVADNLIGEGVEENAYGFGGGVRALRSRVLPLSNKELSEFIVLDADVVMSVYTRRMGPTIEMHRMWGSRNMDAQLDELQTYLITNNYSPKMRENIRWEMEAVRDRVLNQFHAKNPLSWDNRVARAVKNLTNVQIMGRGVYSQVVEVAKTVAIEGHAPMFKALHASFRKGLEGVGHGKHSRAAGEGLEMAMARSLNRGIEQDSAMVVTSQTSIERGLARLQTPFFNANLMNPVTVLMKDFSSIMSAHRLISDSKTLSAALDSGKTLATLSKSESKLAAELASWGINPRTAQVIAKMPVDKTDDLLYLPNIDAWEGRAGEVARDAFLGAMSGIIRSNIVTPGPLQRAAIMDGVFRVKKGGIISRTLGDGGDRLELPMLSLPFQLLSFTMSSSAKTTHAMLSGRDRNAYITLTSMLVGGYLATYLASGDNWENMTWQETAMSAIDRSGVLGWGFDPIKRVEALTGYGPRAALGMEEFGKDTISDEIGAVGGPGAGVMSGVAEAFISDDLSDQQAASNIRRGIPLAGLVWWDEFLKDMTRSAAKNSGLEIDLDPPSMFAEEEEEAFDESMIEPGMVTQQ